MSTPIVENIIAFLTAAIDEITETNGYNQDLTAIRPKRLNIEAELAKDGVVFVVADDPEQWEDGGNQNSCEGWVLPVIFQAIVLDSDDATTAIGTRLNQVRADIEKKIAVDRKCDSNAKDLLIRPPKTFLSERFTAIQVKADVYYRTAWGDPYTKA